MAGDYVPYEVGLAHQHKTLVIGRAVGANGFEAASRLCEFWGWVTTQPVVLLENGVDGAIVDVDVDTLVDARVDASEFFNAMISVGWLGMTTIDGRPALLIPAYNSWLSKTAIARRRKGLRQRKWRERRNVDASVDASVDALDPKKLCIGDRGEGDSSGVSPDPERADGTDERSPTSDSDPITLSAEETEEADRLQDHIIKKLRGDGSVSDQDRTFFWGVAVLGVKLRPRSWVLDAIEATVPPPGSAGSKTSPPAFSKRAAYFRVCLASAFDDDKEAGLAKLKAALRRVPKRDRRSGGDA